MPRSASPPSPGSATRSTDRARQERSWATKGAKKEQRDPTDNDRAVRASDWTAPRSSRLGARRTERAIERLETVDKPWEGWDLRFSIGEIAPVGRIAAELTGAVVERGSFRLGPIDLAVSGGERISITGANGAGKSTLLAALLGDTALAEGSQRLGPATVPGRLDQARERFAGSASLLAAFCEETATTVNEARAVLAKFGLTAEHVARHAADLSPGERTRAVLAAFQVRGVNTLVLDEPTNHLDLPAIEQLEAALDRYEGTLLCVSHDRAFLDALRVTRRITVTDGRVAADGPARRVPTC